MPKRTVAQLKSDVRTRYTNTPDSISEQQPRETVDDLADSLEHKDNVVIKRTDLTGNAGKIPRVKTAEDGVDFIDTPETDDPRLPDTPDQDTTLVANGNQWENLTETQFKTRFNIQNTQRTDEDINDIVQDAIQAGTNVTVAKDDAANTVTINAVDTNTQRTDREIRDVTGAQVRAGTNITVDKASDNSTITINATQGAPTRAQIQDRLSEGNNVTIRTDPNDSNKVEISSIDTNTQRSDGEIRRVAADQMRAGPNIQLDDNPSQGTVTISATDTNTQRTDDDIRGITEGQIEAGDNITLDTTTDPNKIRISSTDTNTQRTDEEIRDVSAAQLQAGTNVSIDKDDAANTVTISATSIQRSNEEIRDVIGNALRQGTNVQINVSDANDTITISATDTNTQRSDEEIRDLAAGIIQAGANVTINKDDTNDTVTISATDTNTQRTDEEIIDLVGHTIRAGNNVTVNVDDNANTVTINAVQKADPTAAEIVTIMDNPANDSERLDYGDLKNRPTFTNGQDGAVGPGTIPIYLRLAHNAAIPATPSAGLSVSAQGVLTIAGEAQTAGWTLTPFAAPLDFNTYDYYVSIVAITPANMTAVAGTPVPQDTGAGPPGPPGSAATVNKANVEAVITAGNNITIDDDPADPAKFRIASTDTNTQRTDAEIQTVTSNQLQEGSNVSLNKAGNTITISATDTNTQRTDEEINDLIQSSLVGGTNVNLDKNDATNTVTINATDTNTQRSDEEINDLIQSAITAGANITVDKNDATDTVTISGTPNTQRTDEEINDIIQTTMQAGTNVSLDKSDTSNTVTINSIDTLPSKANVQPLITAGNNITIDNDPNNADKFRISSTDTNTQRTDEEIRDVIGTTVRGGSNVTIDVDDNANTVTVNATQRGPATKQEVENRLSAGDNVTIDTDPNDATKVRISSTDTDTVFTPSQQNLYSAVKAIMINGTNTTVSEDDTSSTIAINSSGGSGGTIGAGSLVDLIDNTEGNVDAALNTGGTKIKLTGPTVAQPTAAEIVTIMDNPTADTERLDYEDLKNKPNIPTSSGDGTELIEYHAGSISLSGTNWARLGTINILDSSIGDNDIIECIADDPNNGSPGIIFSGKVTGRMWKQGLTSTQTRIFAGWVRLSLRSNVSTRDSIQPVLSVRGNSGAVYIGDWGSSLTSISNISIYKTSVS